MDKRILFISQGSSFMGNSIQKKLESFGFDITHIEPIDEELIEGKNAADVFVFCLGKFIDDTPKFLFRLEDICLKERKALVLLGSGSEMDFVKEKIPSVPIDGRFQRPIDFKRLTDKINSLLGNVEEVEEKIMPKVVARPKSILLVDDDPTFLKMMKAWLSDHYRVTIVTSGTQALLYLAGNKPDLILLDYEMPVTSGPQVLEMIRSEKNFASIPVMFLTGKDDRESVLKVLSLKPAGYLLKSLKRDQILSSVNEFFADKE